MILSTWIALIFFIAFGAGVIIDIFFIGFYRDRLRSIFDAGLKKVPWFFRDVLRISIGLFFIYIAFNISGSLILKLNPYSKGELRPVLNIINGIGIYGIGIWYIIRSLSAKCKTVFEYLGIRQALWIKKVLQGLVFYVGFFPILIGLTYIGIVFCVFLGIEPEPHPLVDILKKEKSILFFYYLVLVATIIAPVFEELLFRGLFYQALKKQMGMLMASVISSGFFSLLHFNTAQFLPIAGLGMLLCFIFEYTNSIIPAVFIHIFNNGLFLGLFFLLKESL